MCMVVRWLRIYPEQSIVQSVAGVRTLTLHGVRSAISRMEHLKPPWTSPRQATFRLLKGGVSGDKPWNCI